MPQTPQWYKTLYKFVVRDKYTYNKLVHNHIMVQLPTTKRDERCVLSRRADQSRNDHRKSSLDRQPRLFLGLPIE